MSRRDDELGQAQAAAESARRLLVFPSVANLDQSRSHLEQACASLKELARTSDPSAAGRGSDMIARLRALQLTGRRVAVLVEGAASFQAGWLRVVSDLAATGGYTPEGQPAPQLAPRSLSIEG